MSRQAVGLGTPIRHPLQPVSAKPNDLLDAKTPPEAATHLRLVMAFETKDREILDPVVRRTLVYVMNLNGSPG